MRLAFLLSITTALFLVGCDSQESASSTGAILVANQGNFSDGNGSISRIDPEAGQASTPVTGLGTILQSLLLDGGTLYAASNIAGRLDVFDAATLARTGQIAGLISPRYIAKAAGRLYVTNLYADASSYSGGTVSVVDPAQRRVVGTIPVGDNPEGIAAVGARVFVANHGFGAGSTVTVIDAATHAVVRTVDVGCDGPRTVLVDADRDVWVVCTGRTLYDAQFNVIGQTSGALRELDGTTGEVTRRIAGVAPLGAEGPGQDAIMEGDALYVVQQGRTVVRVHTASGALTTLFSVTGDPIGAMAVEGATVYLGRVSGFTTAGSVTRHRLDGTETARYTVGVAPTFLLRTNGD